MREIREQDREDREWLVQLSKDVKDPGWWRARDKAAVVATWSRAVDCNYGYNLHQMTKAIRGLHQGAAKYHPGTEYPWNHRPAPTAPTSLADRIRRAAQRHSAAPAEKASTQWESPRPQVESTHQGPRQSL